jgi:uncharacterized protein YdbL (DUF1318 family)
MTKGGTAMKTRTLPAIHAACALVLGAFAALSIPSAAKAAAAQNPDMTNPAIKKFVDSRIARLPNIDKYKALGIIGENNHASVEIRSADAVKDPQGREEVQRLVQDENADRTAQFLEVAKQQKKDMSKVREEYAQTFRDRAKAGEWIQLPDGVWKKK